MRRLSGPKITVQENCNKTFFVFLFQNTIKRTLTPLKEFCTVTTFARNENHVFSQRKHNATTSPTSSLSELYWLVGQTKN